MRIVQIIPNFGIGGAEIMCENLTYELKKLGHDVTVISMYDYHSAITDRMEKAGVDIRYLNKNSGFDISMIHKIKKILKEVGADAIHTHLYCTKYAVPAAIMAGVKHRIHTVHNVAEKESGKLARKLNKFFFKHCRVIPVALSERIKDSIIKEYGIDKERIPVIYNGIDLTKCQPKTDYSVDGNFKILHIGRFSEQKNHIGLLQAFKLFHENHSDSELWLIGDGEKKAEIEKYVAENNLTSSVKLLGLQSNVYGYLHDADLFTLPSNYEGIPMTLIEAMGSGLPIVASNVGGIPDMITDGKNGFLCEPYADGIASKFEILIKDENLRKSCGMNALVASKNFDSETIAKKYLKIYSGEKYDNQH